MCICRPTTLQKSAEVSACLCMMLNFRYCVRVCATGHAVSQGTSIFLIGMMGSGKSTAGRMLANVLKYCFFDSDTVIEQAVGGASITEIFASNGESGFRDMEQAVLSELCSYRNCVIATGGGVVARYGCLLVTGCTHQQLQPVEACSAVLLVPDMPRVRPQASTCS